MGSVGLVVLRARARSGLLLSVGAIVAVAAFFVCVILGGVAVQSASAVRTALTTGAADADSLRLIVTPTTPDDEQQASSATAALIDELVPQASSTSSTDAAGVVVFVLTAREDAVSPTAAISLRAEVDSLIAAVGTDPIAEARIALEGGLPGTLADLDRGLIAVSAITPVPVLITLSFAAIALAQLARLLGAARLTETDLLRARGATRGQIAGLAAVESAAVAVPGVLVGAGLAVCLLALRAGWRPETATGWPAAVIAGALAPVVFSIDAWRRSAGSSVGRRAEASGRGTGATATAAVIAAIAAGIAIVQLGQYGSPLVPSADGGVRVDLLAVSAPLLVLVAGSLIALLTLRPLAGIVERLAARRASLTGVLSARQVARRVAMFQVALLLVCLAIASAVFASGYSHTWRALAEASAEQATGADVRAVFDEQAPPADAVRAVAGVGAAAPVATAPIRIGSDDASLTALSPELVASVMLDACGTVDPTTIADAIASPPPGLELPSDASSLRAAVDVAAPDGDGRGAVEVSAWLTGPDGALASVPLGRVPIGVAGPTEVSVPLPAGGTWRLLAVDGSLSGADGATDLMLSVVSWAADADTLPAPPAGSAPLSSREPLGRIMATERADTVVPAVVTDALATRLGLVVGDRFDYQFDGLLRSGSAEVRGTTTSVPGSTTPLGVVLPLATLDDALLRENDTAASADEIWAATTTGTDVAAVAAEVSEKLGDAAVISAALPGTATRLAEPGVAAVWAGVAAAIALAVIAIAAISVTLVSGRASEAGLLRALGVTARAQAGGRAMELAVVTAAGVLSGLVVGAVAVLCAAGPFANGSVAEGASIIRLAPTIGIAGVAAAIAVAIAALTAVIVVYAARVRRQASDVLVTGDVS